MLKARKMKEILKKVLEYCSKRIPPEDKYQIETYLKSIDKDYDTDCRTKAIFMGDQQALILGICSRCMFQYHNPGAFTELQKYWLFYDQIQNLRLCIQDEVNAYEEIVIEKLREGSYFQ